MIDEASELAEATNDKPLATLLFQGRSFIARKKGDQERVHELLEEGLSSALAVGSPCLVALAMANLSDDLRFRGDLDRAEALTRNAQQMFAAMGNRRDIPLMYLDLAEIARERGDLLRSEDMIKLALDIARDIGSMRDIADGLSALARVLRLKGDHGAALRHLDEAMHWYQRSGFLSFTVRCLDDFADVVLALGEPERAAWCVGGAEGALAIQGNTRLELLPGEHQARVDAIQGVLGEVESLGHFERGRSTPLENVLTELRQWCACTLSVIPGDAKAT